jgi:membrane protease YdiL (CAAX protease family)
MPSEVTLSARRTLSRCGLAYALFFLLAYGTQLLGAPLLSLLPEKVAEAPLTVWLSSLFPMYAIAFPAFYFTIRSLPEGEHARRRLRPRHFFLFLAVSYAVMYLCNLLGVAINTLTDLLLGRSSEAGATELIESSPLLYILLFAVLLGPTIEELMFRRLLLSRLRPFGDGFAILASALAFGFFHGNLSQFFYAFAVGLLLGYLYTATGRIRYPILLHITLNFVGSILPLLVTRAVDIEAIENAPPEAILSLLPSLLLMFGYLAFILLAVGAGLCLVPVLLRRVRLAPAACPIPKEERRQLFYSVGFLCFVLATLVNLVLSYL